VAAHPDAAEEQDERGDQAAEQGERMPQRARLCMEWLIVPDR
jgi:hypothetical protein